MTVSLSLCYNDIYLYNIKRIVASKNEQTGSNFGIPERFLEKSMWKIGPISDIVLSIFLHSYLSFSTKYLGFKYTSLSVISFSKRNLAVDFLLTLSYLFDVFISPIFLHV